MACGVGNIDADAVLKQLVKPSNVFARGATLFDIVVVYSGVAAYGAPRGRSVMSTIASFDCVIFERLGRYFAASPIFWEIFFIGEGNSP